MAVSVNNVRNVIEIVQRNKNSVKKFQLNSENKSQECWCTFSIIKFSRHIHKDLKFEAGLNCITRPCLINSKLE